MSDKATFYIDKSSGTFADTLVTFGWMRVLAELHEKQETSHDIHLRDDGAYFTITCATIAPGTLDSLRDSLLWPGSMPIILTSKNREKLPDGIEAYGVDYEEQKDIEKFYRNWQQKRKGRSKAGVLEAEPPKPRAGWEIIKAMNQPSIQAGYIRILKRWWEIKTYQPELVSMMFQLFSTVPNPIYEFEKTYKELAKSANFKALSKGSEEFEDVCFQVLNPHQGMGANIEKFDLSNSAARSLNLKGSWLLEWVKLAGIYEVGITNVSQQGRKTHILNPKRLSYLNHRMIFNRFVRDVGDNFYGIKGDILAVLGYTKTLLTYFLEQGDTRFLLNKRIQRDVIAGFHAAFYKKLGGSDATMNISLINLPGWVFITSPDDVNGYRQIMEDLETFCRQFNESHSDALNLLHHLRDFISGDSLDALFRFTRAFPAYYIGKRERQQYAVQFNGETLERIITMTERRYTEILEDEGFRNIANAIRQSTVIAHREKMRGKRKYDVRYGLGQELIRKSRYEKDFIAALSEFMFKYNAENSQTQETKPYPPYRKNINMGDISSIVALIDKFGSETIANLLVAYGYASSPYKDDSTESDTSDDSK